MVIIEYVFRENFYLFLKNCKQKFARSLLLEHWVRLHEGFPLFEI